MRQDYELEVDWLWRRTAETKVQGDENEQKMTIPAPPPNIRDGQPAEKKEIHIYRVKPSDLMKPGRMCVAWHFTI